MFHSVYLRRAEGKGIAKVPIRQPYRFRSGRGRRLRIPLPGAASFDKNEIILDNQAMDTKKQNQAVLKPRKFSEGK